LYFINLSHLIIAGALQAVNLNYIFLRHKYPFYFITLKSINTQ